MTPSGTSMLGLVKHLAAVEYGWFCDTFGRETEPLPFDDDDPEADLRIEPGDQRRTCWPSTTEPRAAANQVVAELELTDTRHGVVG